MKTAVQVFGEVSSDELLADNTCLLMRREEVESIIINMMAQRYKVSTADLKVKWSGDGQMLSVCSEDISVQKKLSKSPELAESPKLSELAQASTSACPEKYDWYLKTKKLGKTGKW